MRVFTTAGTLAATVVAVMAAGAASAAIIDFTASSATSGSTGGATWSLTPSAGDTITFVDSDAPGPIGPLAGANDGVGLNNDEITEGSEFLTVSFSKKVRLTGFFTLDLFEDGLEDTTPENAMLFAGSTPSSLLTSLDATEVYGPGGIGFGQASFSFVGDTFTFTAGSGNDNVGKGDFALAGLEIAAIPIPASGLLIGSALAGMGLMGRRRTR